MENITKEKRIEILGLEGLEDSKYSNFVDEVTKEDYKFYTLLTVKDYNNSIDKLKYFLKNKEQIVFGDLRYEDYIISNNKCIFDYMDISIQAYTIIKLLSKLEFILNPNFTEESYNILKTILEDTSDLVNNKNLDLIQIYTLLDNNSRIENKLYAFITKYSNSDIIKPFRGNIMNFNLFKVIISSEVEKIFLNNRINMTLKELSELEKFRINSNDVLRFGINEISSNDDENLEVYMFKDLPTILENLEVKYHRIKTFNYFGLSDKYKEIFSYVMESGYKNIVEDFGEIITKEYILLTLMSFISLDYRKEVKECMIN